MSNTAHELLARVEARRQAVSACLSAKHRSEYGQFFTPSSAASFLGGRVDLPEVGTFRLLDPGAGVGSLSAALVARVIDECPSLELHITAFEVDEALLPHLSATLEDCAATAASRGCIVRFDLRNADFVEYATGWLFETPDQFDAVVANPPYRKVRASAPERLASESRGLRASNLYTIFTGLAADLLVEGGQMSVIIPRSWANGPYHEPFRRFLLDRIGLDFVHVYEQRGKVFADADVLQENVVFHGVRGARFDVIVLSSSSGSDEQRIEREVSAKEVLHPDDPHMFVRIPTDRRATKIAEQMAALPATIADLNVSISTGRVVDFRAKASLREEPGIGTVPLIYPVHLRDGRVVWPAADCKKPNALHRSEHTAALVLPNETYVLVKRFTAKEESRRVVAAVSQADHLPGAEVAFENHLNVYHRRNRGIPPHLALGLSAFLNSTLVDQFVRSFSGHTQINATDLRQLRYPDVEQLARIGRELAARAWPAQRELDVLVSEHVPTVANPLPEAA